jgi:hypothetical protein
MDYLIIILLIILSNLWIYYSLNYYQLIRGYVTLTILLILGGSIVVGGWLWGLIVSIIYLILLKPFCKIISTKILDLMFSGNPVIGSKIFVTTFWLTLFIILISFFL